MKLVDKLKDMFTYSEEPEEDEEEVKIEHIVKETPKVVNEEKIEKVEVDKPDETEEVIKEEVKPEEPQKTETLSREKTKTPIFFTENDFADLEPERPKRAEIKPEITKPKKEEKKLYSGGYTSTTILTKEKPTFKPTPIISPIFGILGENYEKDEIVEKNQLKKDSSFESSDGMSTDKFDQVRNKAYGTIEKKLEDTMYDKTEKSNSIDEEIDLFDELEEQQDDTENTAKLAETVTEQEKNIRELEEITMDLTKELDNLLLKKESFNSKKEKVSKQMKEENSDAESPLTEDELFNLIDSMYEEGKE